ncbi:MAG TPA: M20/M25/M40 family metallo-hydrolase [Thermomicrobiaceae bacterium]|nr:M20/M25/M40 family metallo-hydrolase [Thermomicrobiaceae bacterium]
MTPEEMERVRAAARSRIEATAELTARICAVPAPGGLERERAEFVAGLLRERGYDPVIDEISNVYVRRGQRGGPVLMLLAHIDTVFPAGTPIEVRREGDLLHGPGIGDNSNRVAAMIEALEILDELGIETPADIIAVADVGEEGLGNLRGARAAVERYRDELGAVVVLDGPLGSVTHGAVGSKRWRVTVTGPGGHSFGAFGTPSAIHGLGRIIAAIADVEVPKDPKTTYNVGTIEGGTSVNTIAARASALVDMRSTDPAALDRLAARVRELVELRVGPGLQTSIEVVGERPAGSRPQSDPLVQLAGRAVRWIGLEPSFGASSTDANIPISLGIPAVVIGITHGGGTHTVEEYLEVPPIGDGLAHATRLTVEASELVASGGATTR